MSWLTGYNYRKAINIGLATGAGTNYQVKVIVQPGVGSDSPPTVYLNNKCQYFPNDIAFTSNDGETELKYWYEYDSNTFYVKVPANLDSNQTIYLYYGNLSALPYPVNAPVDAVWKRYSGNPVLPLGTDGTDDDANTKSLLHMDGVDTSTTFNDRATGGSSHAWTSYGGAQIDTAQSVFGGASGLFDGTDDYIQTPYSSDFDFWSGNFTWDFRVRFNALDTTKIYTFMGLCDSGATNYNVVYVYYNSPNWVFEFDAAVSGVMKGSYYFVWTGVATSTWYHVALVRSGSTFKIFIDGVSQTLTTGTAISTNSITPAVQCKFTVARMGERTTGYFFDGWVDEVRISNSARWSSNFTAPTMPYVWDNYWVQMNSMVLSGSTYYAYYIGSTNDWIKKTGLATSSDGVTWTKNPNPVLKPGASGLWDDNRASYPMVWLEGSNWYMLYQGGKLATGIYSIGLATSSDGITWTKSGSNPIYTSQAAWDSEVMQPGTRMLKEGSVYYLYYYGAKTGVQGPSIGLATSTNLTSWTASANNPLIVPGAAGSYDESWCLAPTVIKFGSTYYMFYEAVGADLNRSRMAMASSASKDTGWSKFANNPIFEGAAGLIGSDTEPIWDTTWVEIFVLMQFGNEWRVYYGGETFGSTNKVQTGYAVYTKTGVGGDVFLLFDDFHGASVDATKWGVATLIQDQDTAQKYASNTNTGYYLKSNNAYTGPLAVEAKCKVGSDWADEYGWLWALLFDSAWQTTGYLAGHYRDSTPSDYTRIYKYGTGATNNGTNEAITANTFYKYSLRVGNNAQKVFVDGVEKGNIATSIQTNPTNVFLHTTRLAAVSAYTAYFEWVFVRKYVDSEPAISSFGTEEILVLVLTVADLSHANGLGSVALTQVHNLTVAGLNHANAVDNVVLAQIHQLAVQALSHAHSVGEPALAQVHQLIVQALNHVHNLDGLTLSQVHNLIVQNLAHGHSIGNVILSLEFLLIVENLIHTHSLGTTNLSQNSLLIVQALLHGHALENISLTQIKNAMEQEFRYQLLKSNPPPSVPEGGFAYERSSLKEITPSDGAWFDTPWFDDWFGADEDFTYKRLN